jgi:GMP synthase-like glutamine amidotransferase
MRALIFQHIACEGPGLLGDFLRGQGVSLHTVHLDRGDAIPDPADFDLLVVLGGPMNVYEEDRYPFLAPEDRAIRRAVAAGVPYLGFCLGSQLLAKALKARVTANPVKEIGFFDVSLTPAGRGDPLFRGVAEPLPVFQWHGDTFAIPAGAAHLASSPRCAHQAFRHGEAAYGFQFHVEVTRPMVEEWLRLYAEEVAATPGLDAGRILAEADGQLTRMAGATERIFLNFFDAVLTRRPRP